MDSVCFIRESNSLDIIAHDMDSVSVWRHEHRASSQPKCTLPDIHKSIKRLAIGNVWLLLQSNGKGVNKTNSNVTYTPCRLYLKI